MSHDLADGLCDIHTLRQDASAEVSFRDNADHGR
ncbi:Uncharacterised protein [Vibrio cholerae]|nr:Uncharacterised protein [Vibrio cholerae]